ncbi:MAG: polysaccharide biosynthesis/export family protein [Paludibacter sp.]
MHRSIMKLLFILTLAFQLTSCITTRQINYLQPPKNFIPAYKDTVAYNDYRLRVGDKLYIQVYSTDDKTNALFNGSRSSSMQMMSGSSSGSGEMMDLYTNLIHPNGSIKLPLVGEVYVQGLTLREAKGAIEESIKPVLKLNSVDVRMMGQYFSIIGAGKSGRFPITREKVNIFQAIAMAGDFGFYADRSRIKILRENIDGSSQIKVFDIRSVDIIHSEYYYLEPDDVIFLQPMKEQFFGVSTFWTAVSTIITTFSFGVIIKKSFFTSAP